MARLNLRAVAERVAPLGGRESYDREFIFELLLAYGKPQANVTRLRNGSLNVADDKATEVAQKNVVYFKETTGDPLAVIDELKSSPTVVRYRTRFVIVTDYLELLAVDTKTGENLMIPIRDIHQHFTFFLPWAGMEKAQYVAEAHADVRAAERMGKLFDELLGANPGLLDGPNGRHALNVFFTRLLFCLFAEDTGIFGENQFTNAVGSHTQPDGSDVADFLTDLFLALDTEHAEDKPRHLATFPYVNGRLFAADPNQGIPAFTKRARDLLIEAGTLIWREINPDIFGSMFQAVVNPEERSNLGQHYTSVPNILKTIEPLFLDGLREQFDAGFDSVRKLEALLDRISAIRVFDPACGSGNFLVIAYKELRKLEHAILERLARLDPRHQVLFTESRISIENFHGIELADFASEIAILSLWIAKHQMNTEFKEKFNVSIPLIPLKETGKIRRGNAARVDWNDICPNDGGEIYLIGNPPYKGAKAQTAQMKADFPFVFGGRPFNKNLDYIALWFVKGADYIAGSGAQLAFVTTNSVSQGEHVGLMFPMIFARGVEIGYAYTSFKWENNAKRNAGVTVAVISLRNRSAAPKYLYTGDLRIAATNINGYLADGADVVIERRKRPLGAGLPEMVFGSMPRDGGGLVLSPGERREMLASDPASAQFIKRYTGSSEFIKDGERYCLWIPDDMAPVARSIDAVRARLDRVAQVRSESKADSTAAFAAQAHRFVQISYRPTDAIIVPKVSSARREYIPIGYADPDTVISDLAFAVYGAEPWVFALLTSAMHVAWTRAVGGQMKTDYRYSNTIVYNNFPVPPLTGAVKEELTVAAFRVLDVREYHCERTLAELYDPQLMPPDLRAAHAGVDDLVDSLYSKRGYETDEQRLSDLFALYEAMTAEVAA
ncbi:class I SAM-dependent DNA methyltransferase [Paractinoplanes brasiliensis]|uniref:site-specific DNA-methyltransferase (adenine-specific) n=1 Tax=Paractinoplanes brasiliensis TaxID=52695 RepID=A0A4R6JA53_9ACTN|nr:DNA methyltransferase [Actinoplanes brasiliensis]TDO32540.1 type II restriction/modification system DNA methylase subunit YeeA [Actinoplanes brasiliensis]GID27584.1 putative DNA methyltransferase YeeA [Actinoplanes brasiliensis]